jgi:hypothetical protein
MTQNQDFMAFLIQRGILAEYLKVPPESIMSSNDWRSWYSDYCYFCYDYKVYRVRDNKVEQFQYVNGDLMAVSDQRYVESPLYVAIPLSDVVDAEQHPHAVIISMGVYTTLVTELSILSPKVNTTGFFNVTLTAEIDAFWVNSTHLAEATRVWNPLVLPTLPIDTIHYPNTMTKAVISISYKDGFRVAIIHAFEDSTQHLFESVEFNL